MVSEHVSARALWLFGGFLTVLQAAVFTGFAFGVVGPVGYSVSQQVVGETGKTGEQGLTGPRGETGPIGPAGNTGAIGPRGLSGASGARGVAGPIGPRGLTGPQGARGETGPKGATGPMGPAGATGPLGPAGATGATGATGPIGPTGVVAATSPITYNSTTKTVGINLDVFDHLGFVSTPTSAPAIGQLRWNSTDGTLDLPIAINGSGAIGATLQLGQEQVAVVLNNTQSDLLDGRVVRITGSSGQRLTVAYAASGDETTSMTTFGVLTQNVAKNGQGYATVSGLVRDIPTGNWQEGAILWLDPSVAGGMTTVKPQAPNHLVQIGYVIRSSPNAGIIYVNVQNGYELEELHDVQISGPTLGQMLSYDSVAKVWKNVGAGSACYVNGFTGNYEWYAVVTGKYSLVCNVPEPEPTVSPSPTQ